MPNYQILTKAALADKINAVVANTYSPPPGEETKALTYDEVNSIKNSIASKLNMTIAKFILTDGTTKDYTSKQLVLQTSISVSYNTCTVTFDSNGGTSVPSVTVNYGDKVSEPDSPSMSGYTFEGWYLNDSLYNFDTAVESNITLIAQWTNKTENAYVGTAIVTKDVSATLTSTTLDQGVIGYTAVIEDYPTSLVSETISQARILADTKKVQLELLGYTNVTVLLYQEEAPQPTTWIDYEAKDMNGLWIWSRGIKENNGSLCDVVVDSEGTWNIYSYGGTWKCTCLYVLIWDP